MSGRPLASLFALTLLLMVSAAGTEAGLTETLLSGAGEFQTVERAIAEIPAGASEDLLALEGAGVLRALRFRLINSGGHLLRGAVLEMRWDGDPQPAVRVPLGDFFGLVRGRLEPLDTTFLKVRG